ncbi:MAG TPA: OB-fold domain-containing protein [Mycobacteriales bacterium]|nr:OB-fold domain-containing protein [Mycobacteriales bacterium]
MTVRLQSVATYVPRWGDERRRIAGPDEDAITMAVAAGRAAIGASGIPVDRVVLVTRDLPTLEGSAEAVLIAGLDLGSDLLTTIVVGGGPAALDLTASAEPGTLVVAVDVSGAAGAAAVLVGGAEGATLEARGRTERSLPVLVRDSQGGVFDYADPRLLRVRGLGAAMAALGLDAMPIAVAGVSAKDAASYVEGKPAPLPTTGASSALFALAAAIDADSSGTIVATEQGTATAARLTAGPTARANHSPEPRTLPRRRSVADAEIKISLPAYERAFDGKVRLAAGRCSECGNLDLPQRYRCSECGAEASSALASLPRDATVYTAVSVHVPVPGLLTPYDLAIVDLGDSGVRLLAPVTDAEPGSTSIGDNGSVVLRRIAVRAGVPDYGYAFVPEEVAR